MLLLTLLSRLAPLAVAFGLGVLYAVGRMRGWL
jgi:hypothetical protein